MITYDAKLHAKNIATINDRNDREDNQTNQPYEVVWPDVDVEVQYEGSIYLFHLKTELARTWVSENVTGPKQFFGSALVVEHRYAATLADGMTQAGLEIKGLTETP